MRARLAALTLLVATALAPSTLHAAPPDDRMDPRIAARALADHGYALYEAGKYLEAIEILTEADKLYHAPTLVFALAKAHVAVGHLVEAKALFQRVADEQLPASAPPAFHEVQRTAKDEVAALERRIPLLRIVVRGGGGYGLRVTLDDADLPNFRPDNPRPVNPGTHRVTAVPLGGVGVGKTVEAREGERVSVEIDLPTVAPVVAAPTPLPAPPPAPPPPAQGSLVPALVGFGVGVLGLGLGVGAGVSAKNSASDLVGKCGGDVCPPTTALQNEYASAKGMATASTIGFVVAGLGAATGVVLLVVRPGGRPASVGVALGPAAAAVTGRF